MYWNNPIIEVSWPTVQDPILDSSHNGKHCLFYDPVVDKQKIKTNQTLQELCNWANSLILHQTLPTFFKDSRNHYDIANLVKLNIWVTDLQSTGIIKPMMLHYTGDSKFSAGTGESRLRAIERIPGLTTVKAFISTQARYQDLFDHLELVTTFDRFAELCAAEHNQQFLFRLTDNQAPYGIDWYEYNSSQTVNVTPGQDYCVEVLSNYLLAHPVYFTPEWFDVLVPWNNYKTSV